MVYFLFLIVVVFFSGSLLDKIGLEVLIFIGLVFISLGLILMVILNVDLSLLVIIIFIGIMFIGMGLF